MTELAAPGEAMVYVVDDDEGARTATLFLVRSMGFRGRGYESAGALLAAIDRLPLGCVLTDLRMPEITGIQLLGMLRQRNRGDAVVVMTAYADVPVTIEAFRGGAVHLLEKPFSATELQQTLNECFETLVARRDASARQAEAAARLALLAPRETEVAREVAMGHSTKVIARRLRLSPRTVDAYRANIYAKTGCSSIADIVAMVMANSGDAD